MTIQQAIKLAKENKVIEINYTNEENGFKGTRRIRIFNVGLSLTGLQCIRVFQYSGASFSNQPINTWKLLLLKNINSYRDLGVDQLYINSRPPLYSFSGDLGMVRVDFLKGL